MPQSPREFHHTGPAVERLDYHRKAAKDLLAAARAGDPAARARIGEALGDEQAEGGLLGDEPAELRLADAQRAIAREHGHTSWASFRRELEAQAGAPTRSVGRIGPGSIERYERAAEKLLGEIEGDGAEPARRRLRAHVPRLAGLDDAALNARAAVQDARLVVAREFGFPTWRALVDGVREETTAWRRGQGPHDTIRDALDAIRTANVPQLRTLLDAHPDLVKAEVGAGGSLLGAVAQPDVFGSRLGHALGVDRECVELLIERGSELDGPLNLAACFDRVELVEILLAAGARPDVRGIHGITPLETAVYHAARASADVLARIALVPDAPWIAAGTGRVDRLEGFLNRKGGLAADAYRNRPNPADVGWLHRLPAREVAQDVLDEALVHAAQNERPEAVAWLLAHGADPDACPYQGCGALHLAAAFGAIESVKLLIADGADIERRNDFNGDNALGWAEYVLARERPGDPGVAAVRDLLRERGSRPAVWGA